VGEFAATKPQQTFGRKVTKALPYVAALVFVIVRYLIVGGGVPGFSFLASMIAIFSGAQLFALGVIGEYLGRMHARSMQQPTYTVREVAETRSVRAAEPENMPRKAALK